ncbi:MAG TPA: TIGR02757 family protein [Candidatus Hydrogenedentes bacterium]|nr:TIGR02757 family protein [Candidatus Hydrogenedentota bacterium]
MRERFHRPETLARNAAPVRRAALERIYREYTRAEYVHTDPLAAVLRFSDPADQELVGLIAASLAFGNVKTILRSVDAAIARLPRPAADLRAAEPTAIRRLCRGFQHRFARERELADLLTGARRVLLTRGSLHACFRACIREGDADYLAALTRFVDELRAESPPVMNYLLPEPARGSACKRLWLYLRWMVRRDAVDPGTWTGLDPAKLVIPLDTHMHRICLKLGLTTRKTADARAAIEATAGFRRVCPEDPVRYDFALTRMGMLRLATPP